MPSADITKRAIAVTMKKLMDQEPLAKISVNDIVTECGMTRNSFYYHFKDKFDLVNWIFYTDISEELNYLKIDESPSWDTIEGICDFFYKNKAFYQNALSITGQNSFVEYFTDLLKQVVATRMANLYKEDEDRDFLVTFFSNAFVDAISRWLSDGAETPPDKFAGLIRKAITGVAIRLADKDELSI